MKGFPGFFSVNNYWNKMFQNNNNPFQMNESLLGNYWGQLPPPSSQVWGGFPHYYPPHNFPHPPHHNQNQVSANPFMQPEFYQPTCAINTHPNNNNYPALVQPDVPSQTSGEWGRGSRPSRWSYYGGQPTSAPAKRVELEYYSPLPLSTKVDKVQVQALEKSSQKPSFYKNDESTKDLEALSIYSLRSRVEKIRILTLSKQKFEFPIIFDDFVSASDPVPGFTKVVLQLLYCSKCVSNIKRVKEHIEMKLRTKNKKLRAHLKMRTFWLLGEIYRREYNNHMEKVRTILKGDDLFKDFLKRHLSNVGQSFLKELRAICGYWEKHVPKHMMDSLIHHIPSYLKYEPSHPTYSSMESFYASEPEKRHSISMRNNNNTTSTTCGNTLQNSLNRPSSPNKDTVTKPSWVESQPLTEFERKVKAFSTRLDHLLTIDRTQNVPAAAARVLVQILKFGTDEELSKEIVMLLKGYISGAESKGFIDQKIIRVLWVMGYLFYPEYEPKITAMKDQLEKIAPNLFWNCVQKITGTSIFAREELRVIFHFWKAVMKPEIISSITTRLCRLDTGKPKEQYSWVLYDKDIKKDSRISEFYSNTYREKEKPKRAMTEVQETIKKSNKQDHSKKSTEIEILDLTASTTNVDKLNAEKTGTPSKCSDNETEIILLDKRDTIGQKSIRKNGSSEEALAKKSTDVVANVQPIRKKKLKRAEGVTDLFTDCIRLPSKPKPTTPPNFQTAESKQVDSAKPYTIVKDKTRFEHDRTLTANKSGSQQPTPISKLELFRKQMEKDEAIKTMSFSWNDPVGESKKKYLRTEWSVFEFASYVCSDNIKKWDIVKDVDGKLRVMVERK